MRLYIMIVLFALLACGTVIYHITAPQLFPEGMPRFIVILNAFGYFIGIGLLVVVIILYIRKEERTIRTIYAEFAKEFGGNEAVLLSIEKPQYGSRKTPGIWAEVNISYKNQKIIFAAQNVIGPSRLGCSPFFVISIDTGDQLPCRREDLLVRLRPDDKKFLEQMQQRLGKVELLCQEHNFSLRMPISSKVTSYDLRRAMEILLAISASV